MDYKKILSDRQNSSFLRRKKKKKKKGISYQFKLPRITRQIWQSNSPAIISCKKKKKRKKKDLKKSVICLNDNNDSRQVDRQVAWLNKAWVTRRRNPQFITKTRRGWGGGIRKGCLINIRINSCSLIPRPVINNPSLESIPPPEMEKWDKRIDKRSRNFVNETPVTN